MNESRVHDLAVTSEQLFGTIDQDRNQYLSRAELSDYIAKHPTEVDNVTAAKFMLDNFQLISHLETGPNDYGGNALELGIKHGDLHDLDLLTAPGGVQKLTKESANMGALWGTTLGTPFGVLVLSMSACAPEFNQIMDKVPTNVFVPAIFRYIGRRR